MEKRVAALDGLRGVAILFVVVGHSGIGFLGFGGQVGVTLFFVLSGFLITRIIVAKLDKGQFSFGEFYARRARRLFPALGVLLIASIVIRIPLGLTERWWTETWPAIAYIANIRLLTAGWDSMGFLGHLWSLSVEEQFYLAWPLALLIIPSRHRERVLMALLILLAAWKSFLLATNPDWNRVYLGTDTNAFALLLGGFLAVGRRVTFPPLTKWLALGGLVGLASISSGREASVLLSVFGVAVCGVLVHSSARGFSILEGGVVRWFGTISYGLYLWQGVMFLLIPDTPILAGGLSILLAWLSWQFVERRWLRASPRENDGRIAQLNPAVSLTEVGG